MNNLLMGLTTTTFGGVHILALCICIAVAVISLILLKKHNVSLKRLENIILIIGIISESIKVFTYIVINESKYGGYLPKTDLPFHLCSIQIIFFVILNITQNKSLKKTLYSFMLPTCLVGGIMALLLPTSSARNMPIITVQYFMYHTGIMIFAIYLYLSGEVEFTIRDYFTSLIMLFATLFIAIYLNGWVADYVQDVNFMYVVNPPMEGLPYLNKEYGWLIYIIHYIILGIFLTSLCYIKPIVIAIRQRLKREGK